mgnify:CR=1 FL=1
MHMKNIIASVLVTTALVGSGAFYGGMQYGKTQASALPDFAGNMGGGFDPSQLPPGGARGAGLNRAGGTGGFASGEILSIEDGSLTISLPDGGSKLIFFSDTSEITKSAEGSKSDLTEGTNITITGTANDDGSITATSVQIRPEGLGVVPPDASTQE